MDTWTRHKRRWPKPEAEPAKPGRLVAVETTTGQTPAPSPRKLITEEEYAKALNPNRVLFTVLPARIRAIIQAADCVQEQWFSGAWVTVEKGTRLSDTGIYRIHPDTPKGDYMEFPVVTISDAYRCRTPFHNGSSMTRLTSALCYTGCLGIVFEKDGKETLRTSFDLSFGTPKTIRFKTPETKVVPKLTF